jgi:hypothetical protein
VVVVALVGPVVAVGGAEGGADAFGVPLLLHAAKPNSEMEMTWRPHVATAAGYGLGMHRHNACWIHSGS